MLIDAYMPVFHFREKHSIAVHADADDVYNRMLNSVIDSSVLVRMLLKLRGISVKRKTINNITDLGFVKLDERPGNEIVFALMSNNWYFGRCASAFTPQQFLTADVSHQIKAAINFRVYTQEDETFIATETRVFCNSKKTKNKFRIYWFFIKPFSALIRLLLLRSIKASLAHQ